jgi:hypothetical protein
MQVARAANERGRAGGTSIDADCEHVAHARSGLLWKWLVSQIRWLARGVMG